MPRSKWDDVIDEANAKSKLEDSLTANAKMQMELVQKRLSELRSKLKVYSNFYLFFVVFAIVMTYISVVQADYVLAVFDAIFFVYSLYNFAETYTLIRLYGGKLKVEVKNA